MKESIFVFSERNTDSAPAMCCVVEMEDVLVNEYGARLLVSEESVDSGILSNSIVFFCALGFHSIDRNRAYVTKLRSRGAKVLFYIFDSWNVEEYFYNRTRNLRSRLFPKYAIGESCDWIVVPFKSSASKFAKIDQKAIITLPLAVDSTLADGLNDNRPFTVFGYGRQPKALTAALSSILNCKANNTVFIHTDHTAIGGVTNFRAHRRQFWKTAQMSSIAIAYDNRFTDPFRFPDSIVGQRWFECLAAGCVVVGKRPSSEEADDLLGWEDSTIDLPDNWDDACQFIVELAANKGMLKEIRERNVQNIIERHDWRHRFTTLFELIGR